MLTKTGEERNEVLDGRKPTCTSNIAFGLTT